MGLRKLSCVALLLLFSGGSAALAQQTSGTLSGFVRSGKDAPFRGAFVRIQSNATKITVNVLSDSQGHYQARNLPPGDYQAGATAIGYTSAPRVSVKITARQPASLDFVLQDGTVRWSDLNMYQGHKLLPEGKGKAILERQCSGMPQFPNSHRVKDSRRSGLDGRREIYAGD